MAAKFALIVDDSRIAQVKLRKMLARYELDVDCVASAEEALSYLARRRPAVVFMDHLMKGMDGFEALRVIKSNPDTATVPVIMYTSKSGDLYVGQARALGAIDVLSKDVIEPSSLDKVLGAVKIFPMREPTMAFPAVSITDKPEAIASEPLKAQTDTLRAQIARMLDIHIVRIVQEIGDSNRLMAKRLFRELQELKDKPAAAAAPPPPPRQDMGIRPEPEPARSRYAPWIITIFLSVALALVFHQLRQNAERQATMNEQYAKLNAFIENQYGNVARDNKNLSKRLVFNQSLGIKTAPLYEGLGWAINRENIIPFGQQALNEKQLEVLSRLVHYLHSANFSGVIAIKLFFGNFCVIADASGQFMLPKAETPTSNCYFLEDRLADLSLESQQAWAFSNYLISTPEIQNGRIRVELEARGMSEPMIEYPPLNGTTAGEWNRIAAMNNRVTYIITADD